MKNIFAVALLLSAVLCPLACGKNLSPSAVGPVTVVQVINTGTPTFTGTTTSIPTSTATLTPTPNSLTGYDWAEATNSAAFSARYGHAALL
jgi:hypothetical protein